MTTITEQGREFLEDYANRYQESPRRKRDIRWDIVRKCGMDGQRAYEIPQKGDSDRRFKKEHLVDILKYLDVKPPQRRNFEGTLTSGALNQHIQAVARHCGLEEVPHAATGQWDGFTKDELETIEQTLDDHEPIGKPSKMTIVGHLTSEYDVDTSRARRLAEDLRDRDIGFTLEDINVRTHVAVYIQGEGV